MTKRETRRDGEKIGGKPRDDKGYTTIDRERNSWTGFSR